MSIYENCYDAILEGDYTDEEALDWARGYCFGEDNTSTQNIAHARFIDEVDGIDVHFCYGADHYFFTEAVN